MSRDPDVLGETALAMAQALIQDALTASRLDRSIVATKVWGRRYKSVGAARIAMSRLLQGRHDLTLCQFGCALAVCGFEVEFTLKELK
jgi:hypothetical protein